MVVIALARSDILSFVEILGLWNTVQNLQQESAPPFHTRGERWRRLHGVQMVSQGQAISRQAHVVAAAAVKPTVLSDASVRARSAATLSSSQHQLSHHAGVVSSPRVCRHSHLAAAPEVRRSVDGGGDMTGVDWEKHFDRVSFIRQARMRRAVPMSR